MKEAMSSWPFLLVIVSLIVVSVASGESTANVLLRTSPAYAVAANAKTTLSLPSTCSQELDVFRDAVDARKLWALRVLDSSGEPAPGFIYGNNFWLGSRAQCFDASNTRPLSIKPDAIRNASKYRKIEEEFPPYKLNYFAAHFRHNSTLQYHLRFLTEDLVILGLCLPASCTTDQLSSILRTIVQNRTLMIGNLYATDFKLEDVKNLQNDYQWLKNGTVITVLVVLVITLSLMTAGTAYDVLVYEKYREDRRAISDTCELNKNTSNGAKLPTDVPEVLPSKKIKRPGLIGEVITCFSVHTNTKIIFATKLGSGTVPAIHGLRFFGMVIIIMIHSILLMFDTMDNKVTTIRMSEDFLMQPFRNGSLMVDTYLVLSGFLVAYPYLKSKLKNNTKDKSVTLKGATGQFFSAVLNRFVRLTPAYIMLIGVVVIDDAWSAKSSIFDVTVRQNEVCAKYWWRNLLYISNFYPYQEVCVLWSWYLSVDMQLFVLGMFILILSSTYFYTAAALLGFILVGSSVLTGSIAYIYNYTRTLDQQLGTFHVLYATPWFRAGPHIAGLVAGYILIRLNNKLTLRRRYTVALWLVTISGNLFVQFCLWNTEVSVVFSAFYAALSHTVWGIGIAWMIIACNTDNAGIINTVLTFRGWVPLSRLTYCAYLLNPLIISSVYQHSETAVHVDYFTAITASLGFIVISFICSYGYSLMMEIPYTLLMKLLMKPRNQP